MEEQQKREEKTMCGPLRRRKLRIGTGEGNILDLLAPDPVAVHAADNDGAVLVDDADALALRVPGHAPHHALVPVVDHLLVPGALHTN